MSSIIHPSSIPSRSGVAGPLGLNTKSSPPPSSKQHQMTRSKRFLLLSRARHILRSAALEKGLQVNNLHRTSKCVHTRISDNVHINTSKDTGKAFYSNVAACGSVWACPVCSHKIQEKRRNDVAACMSAAYTHGYTVHMVTLTFPHTHFDKCSDLLAKQKLALEHLRKGGAFTKYLKNKLGYFGVMRSLEVTHGKNGWHPHTHELWVCDKDADFSTMKSRIEDKWLSSLIKSGIVSDTDTKKHAQILEHSVDIHFNADTSDYLAKHDDASYLEATKKEKPRGWGADNEITKQSSKSRAIGRHPFQILADFNAKPNYKDKSLYLEYVLSFSEQRKRQLYIAPKIRKLAGLGQDKTDIEIAEDQSNHEFSGKLTSHDWSIVTERKAQSLLLDYTEDKGYSHVYDWLLINGGGHHILESYYDNRRLIDLANYYHSPPVSDC